MEPVDLHGPHHIFLFAGTDESTTRTRRTGGSSLFTMEPVDLHGPHHLFSVYVDPPSRWIYTDPTMVFCLLDVDPPNRWVDLHGPYHVFLFAGRTDGSYAFLLQTLRWDTAQRTPTNKPTVEPVNLAYLRFYDVEPVDLAYIRWNRWIYTDPTIFFCLLEPMDLLRGPAEPVDLAYLRWNRWIYTDPTMFFLSTWTRRAGGSTRTPPWFSVCWTWTRRTGGWIYTDPTMFFCLLEELMDLTRSCCKPYGGTRRNGPRQTSLLWNR